MKSRLTVIIVAVVLVAVIAAGVIFLPGLLNKEDDTTAPIDSSEKVKVWLVGGFSVAEEGGLPSMNAKIEYDENYNLSKIVYYQQGEVYNITEIKCDNENRITDMIYSNVTQHDEYKYNENGKLTEHIFNWGSGEQIRVTKTEYVYDENGLLAKSMHDNSVTIYEYDESGIRTKEILYIDGTESRYMIYEYDGNGNIKSKTTYNGNSDAELMRYTYKYDSNNNLTEYAFADNHESEVICYGDYTCVEVSPEQAEALNRQQKFFTIGYIE